MWAAKNGVTVDGEGRGHRGNIPHVRRRSSPRPRRRGCPSRLPQSRLPSPLPLHTQPADCDTCAARSQRAINVYCPCRHDLDRSLLRQLGPAGFEYIRSDTHVLAT